MPQTSKGENNSPPFEHAKREENFKKTVWEKQKARQAL